MKIKRNKKSYRWFLCGLILVVVLTITLIKGSRAGYKSTATIELTSGIVKYSSYDFNLISMYIDGVEQDKDTIIPDSGYAINEEQSYCYKESKSNKDTNARLFTDSLGNHVFKGISKGTKCIIYFDKTKTMEELLNNYYTDKRIRTSENKDFNVPYEEETTKTIFSALDDDGTSYYFAGNPTDNWVEFGGYYWRIIRVNGDGTIRMIYQGRTKDENGNKLVAQTTGEETQIGASAFNENANDNAYVGYMYGTPNSNTYEETHENKNSSNAKQVLDNWFINSNIRQGTEYFNKIDLNAGFCGDRQSSTSATEINGSGGIGTITTYYGGLIRLLPGGSAPNASSTAVAPTFNCVDNDDLYTYSESNQGNKKLANPIGMITADEIIYIGVAFYPTSGTTTNYLDTQRHYWTMSPSYSDGSHIFMFFMHPNGHLGHWHVDDVFDVRPTINLKKDVTFTGNGTQSNPYKVVT